MKFGYLIIFAVLFMPSCVKDDVCATNVELEGTWQLVESLADPGDGSGTYQPVEGYYSITFLSDNTFVLNESICDRPMGNINPITGTYSDTSLSFDFNECSSGIAGHSYE